MASESVQNERINMRFWVRGYDIPTATVVMAVNRQAGANAVEVSRSIKEILPVVQLELPGSVRITMIYDRSQSIVNSVTDVQVTLFIAFVLVVVVIFLFLGRATDTLIPAVALPLSLLLTFVAMSFLGYSLDNLSLMALTLAIGFLVDDAIVFLENTVRRMERGEKALARGHRERPGDQLHDPLDDDLARGGLHSARLHVGTGRPDLPRVRGHDHHLDLRLGRGFADADAADVRAAAQGSRPRREEDLDGTGHRRRGEAGPRRVRRTLSGGSCGAAGSPW